jgi:mono/diheme cytochrome c family protein
MTKTRLARIGGMPVFVLLWTTMTSTALWPQSVYRPAIPKTWDETALADWATPIAGLNVRPTHISSKEYYSLPIENRLTYPVYYPGREPEGYWEMLQHVALKPLIEPERLKNEADWIDAGRKIFYEVDDLHLRTFDAKIVAAARARETFEQVNAQALPDGTVYGLRWVPTKQGVALSIQNCSGCHLLYLADGTPVPGAPSLAGVARGRNSLHRVPLVGAIHEANRAVTGAAPFLMGPEPLGAWLYQAYGMPWKKDDINERLKTFTAREYQAYLAAYSRGAAITRWNGSIFYPSKVPDLIGIKERKYIDSTATHLHRGIGDLMRYAALVGFAEAANFGPYDMLLPNTKRAQARLPDEALYALALYIYSLQPPVNPNPLNEKAQAGEKIFAREGCPECHTPPLYTNNKLTLAQGFTRPPDAPIALDVLPLSAGTDRGLALQTRKGTGYYKVPSLKGVWYRGHYLHDGSVASLEEMFDPDRLKDTHTPGGFTPPDRPQRAIKGHEFGLRLDVEERKQLIAFLRTL